MNRNDMAPPKHPRMILEAIEGQSHVTRYNTIPTLQPRQTVAEHVGRGAELMVVVIRELSCSPKFSIDAAFNMLSRFVIHDLGESLTGDVIGPTKEEVPEIANFEDTILQTFVDYSLYTGSNYGELVALVVQMVDMAEGTMYSTEEVFMGNPRMIFALTNYYNALTILQPKVEKMWGVRFDSIDQICHRAGIALNNAPRRAW